MEALLGTDGMLSRSQSANSVLCWMLKLNSVLHLLSEMYRNLYNWQCVDLLAENM